MILKFPPVHYSCQHITGTFPGILHNITSAISNNDTLIEIFIYIFFITSMTHRGMKMVRSQFYHQKLLPLRRRKTAENYDIKMRTIKLEKYL